MASGYASHVEGSDSKAEGDASHAEGVETIASGFASHVEGGGSKAEGEASHAEGVMTVASGGVSHAEGLNTIASSDLQHVQGRYNIDDPDDKYAHIVGNGTEDSRSNAHTLDWSGNAWYQGEVYVGGTSQNDANKLISTGEVATDPDIEKFICEMNLIDIPTAADGSIFTNQNGKIYTL